MFVRVISLRKRAPLLHRAPTIDIDEAEIRPPRISRRSLVVRAGRRGIVLGRWTDLDMEPGDALQEFVRCGLGAPSVWGPLAEQHEILATAQGGNLIRQPGGGDDDTGHAGADG